MKRIVYLLIAIVAIACSNKEKPAVDGGWDVTVSGKVKNPQQGQLLLQELTPNENPKKDSTTVAEDGTYSKTLHLTEPGIFRLNFYNVQVVDVVLDHANVTVNADGNDASGDYEVIGSPDYDLIHDVQSQILAYRDRTEVKDIEAQFQVAGRAKDEKKVSALQDKYMELRYNAYDSIVKNLDGKPVNLGLINLLQSNTFERDRYFPFYKKVADEATAKMPTSVHVKQFADMVSKMAVTAVGQKAPEISLPDPDGKIVTLSSFKGKYVLVDFWASWCGPCRKENPNIVKAYKDYHSKGFEVLGVSLDRDKADWISAAKKDDLTWTQVSDLKYYESQAAADYYVSSIPFSVLVDPNGVIVAKTPRGRALEKELEKIYNKK
jgi:peroxiredoxin